MKMLLLLYIWRLKKMNKKRTDLEIIDEIQSIRSKNNANWMDILRLAFKHSPDEARKLQSKITQMDGRNQNNSTSVGCL